MGNEGSMLQGLELDPQPLENTDEWTLHVATLNCGTTQQLSVFAARQSSGRVGICSLEQAAKNLMLHRHPSILKFVSSWSRQGKLCMATESVRPLTRVLSSQTALQICVGLHAILKALVFLHEKALSSHNNVCCAAIYVTGDGSWKLGGLEFLRRFSELNADFLQKTRARRYEKAVPPEEDSSKTLDPKAIDCFAFGVLVEEVIKKVPEDGQVPGMREFRDMCRKQLQNSEPTLRPQLSQILDQPIFKHKFVFVHDFLAELPVKSDLEKATFFRSLVTQLCEFPEELVASQLGELLLARMVLLDRTAQEYLLPAVLCPRYESGSNVEANPLFSVDIYQRHVVPRLIHIFGVRDAQVRLMLLQHFQHYCSAFEKEQLRTKVLPELLVGIKDTNDAVVASTLRALAFLVPILGAATVIGGKRARLFTDGRPKAQKAERTLLMRQRVKDSKPDTSAKKSFPSVEESVAMMSIAELPERPSPDGGEDLTSASPVDDETDAWSDWDVNETQMSNGYVDEDRVPRLPLKPVSPTPFPEPAVSLEPQNSDLSATPVCAPVTSPSTILTSSLRPALPDISVLDIKNSPSVPQRKQSNSEEFDFFQDMEPVLSKTQFLQLDDVKTSVLSEREPSKSCFDVDLTVGVGDVGEGWGENDDWGEMSDSELTVS